MKKPAKKSPAKKAAVVAKTTELASYNFLLITGLTTLIIISVFYLLQMQ